MRIEQGSEYVGSSQITHFFRCSQITQTNCFPLNRAKNRLHELMQLDHEFTEEDRLTLNPTNSISINQAISFVKNPVQCCIYVQGLIKSLLTIIGLKKDDPKTRDAILYHGETWDLMARRWGKIEKDFSTKNKFDISKIPDIYGWCTILND